MKKHDWDVADSTFHLYLQHDAVFLSDSVRNAIQTSLTVARNSSMLSSQTAIWFSSFIPGLGQLYAGDLKNAVNSLALNSVLGYYVISFVQSHAYFDGFVLFTGGFLRYYLGNRLRAGLIADERNENAEKNLESRILDALVTIAQTRDEVSTNVVQVKR